jgi:hypothetical protein
MASPMRMRGGSAVETGRASIAAAGVDGGAAAATGEDCTRLRFGARFLVALAADGADLASRGEDADDAAAEPDDFAARAAEGAASMVVESPMASSSALLIAAGDASFERLRLLERVLFVRSAGFVAASPAVAGDAAGADAFRFLGMGLCVVAAPRRLEIAAGARCC